LDRSEVVMNCQEVLRYTEPDIARDWKTSW
jgi:hypothetical protein